MARRWTEEGERVVDVDHCRELVALFDDPDALEDAIEALELHGFDRADIAIVAGPETLRRALHRERLAMSEVADDPEAPARVPVDRHERAEGKAALAAALALLAGFTGGAAAVVIGAELLAAYGLALAAGAVGGGLGWLAGRGIERRYLGGLAREVEAGGIVLWVRLREGRDPALAEAVLREHGGRQIHLHELDRPVHLRDVPFATVQPDPFLVMR